MSKRVNDAARVFFRTIQHKNNSTINRNLGAGKEASLKGGLLTRPGEILPVDISHCITEIEVRNSLRHFEDLRRIDPKIDTLVKDGFRFLTNAGSDEISRLVGKYGGFQNVHLSNAYTSDKIHLPNSIGVWVRETQAA